MTVDTEKEKICINKVVEEKTEMVLIEGDSIVPDVKPDVIACINTCGNICIYKKEILDGRVRIDGSIDAYVTYLTDSEECVVRGLNTTIDFTHMIDIGHCTSDMSLELDACIKSIECRVLNGRKINLKANVEFKVRIYENRKEEVIKQILGVNNIQKQNRNFEINSLIGEGNTKVIAKDTLAIDELDNFAEILNSNCKIINKEYKMSYNKILVKADTNIKIMYLTEQNNIRKMESTIPIMGFIDIQNVSEENICDINYLLKNIIIKPNSAEEHSINIEIEIDIDARAYDTKNIDIIEDLYNPDFNMQFTTKDIDTVTQKSKCNQSVFINENISLSEIGSENILDIQATPIITNVNTINDKILYQGEVNLKIISETSTSQRIEIKVINIPFNTEVNTTISTSNLKVSNSIEIKAQSFNINGNNLEIKLELNLALNMYKSTTLRIIDTLEMIEYEDKARCGMTIYFVKEGDTLWKIAKRFRSTIDEIASANDLDDLNKIIVGQQLFIPCCNQNNRKKLA